MAALWTLPQAGGLGASSAEPCRITRQLSDGTQVMAVPDSGGTKISLYYAADHASATLIGSVTPAVNPAYYTLCVDAFDNLFLAYIGTSGGVFYVAAWVKNTGYAWTAKTPLSSGVTSDNSSTPHLLWANTGGGTAGGGHLLLLYRPVGGIPVLASLDAGIALAGAGTLLVSSTAIGSTSLQPLDISGNGFGASLGLLALPDKISSWQVSSAGALTVTSIATSAGFSTTTGTGLRGRLLFLSTGLWMFVSRSTTAAQLAAGTYSLTAEVAAPVACGATPGGASWTLPGTSAAWDAFVDPNTPGRVWVLSWSASAPAAISRLGITSAPLAWDAAAVADDTAVGNNTATAGQFGIFCTNEPRTSVVDYVVSSVLSTTYRLSGDSSQPTPTSNTPTVTSPANYDYVDGALPVTVQWAYNPADGPAQAGYCVRYKLDAASSYLYWNATLGAGQPTPVYNAGSAGSCTLAAGALVNGNVYDLSVSTLSSTRIASSFAADVKVTTAKTPTLTITAPTGTYTTNNHPAITWSPSLAPGLAQVSYQVRLFTAAQAAIGGFDPATSPCTWDSGVVTSAGMSAIVPGNLPNAAGYVAYVQLAQTGGQVSAWTSGTFTLSASLPATPTLLCTPDDVTGSVAVVVTNPTPTGGQPAVTTVDVYRRRWNDGTSGIRVAAGLAPGVVWRDFTVASATAYQYAATVAAASGATTSSVWSPV